MTNGDRIRSMNDEELATLHRKTANCRNCPMRNMCEEDFKLTGLVDVIDCYTRYTSWLKQEEQKMTNYERIKNMTVAEMVEFINCEGTCNYCIYADDDNCKGLKCREGVKAWLNQEADND